MKRKQKSFGEIKLFQSFCLCRVVQTTRNTVTKVLFNSPKTISKPNPLVCRIIENIQIPDADSSFRRLFKVGKAHAYTHTHTHNAVTRPRRLYKYILIHWIVIKRWIVDSIGTMTTYSRLSLSPSPAFAPDTTQVNVGRRHRTLTCNIRIDKLQKLINWFSWNFTSKTLSPHRAHTHTQT